MQTGSDPFKATAANFEDTMTKGGNAGFRVPEYQRTYDWSIENIKRLMEDCLNGFFYLSQYQNQESYTFLGTIILVSEESERSFDGTSLSIVDGQQRLTTLILLCCALIEELFLREKDVRHLQKSTASWIESEIEFIRERLFECVVGQLRNRGRSAWFPRVVRYGEDNRAFDRTDAEYRSVVASFLMEFAEFYQQDDPSFSFKPKKDDAEESRYYQNYDYIKDQVKRGIYEDNNTPDTSRQNELDYEQIQPKDFERAGLRNLFEKLDSDQDEKNRAISHIAKNSDSSGLIRIILFSHYLTKSVILTRVETRDEGSAFDIFDSLNTTGEPLTALETFKPRVMRFENGEQGYTGSESDTQFKRLEENLNDIYPETEKRQTETKELLVTFALYMRGDKLAKNLAAQRAYLRTQFEEAKTSKLKRRIVHSLANIAEFRQMYWNRDSIPKLDSIHSRETNDCLKLCFKFIADMRTSLTIPILTRYWVQYLQDHDEDTFAAVVKALTAFLVLRRSITGGTGGIDSDFRKIMQGDPQDENSGLCIGLGNSKPLPNLDNFTKTLRDLLAVRRIGVKNQETWVSKVREVGLADRAPRSLCRFLLFAASHNARPDPQKPGLLTRKKIIPTVELDFLNFDRWQDEIYATVEHVAPDSNSGGWDEKIYVQPYTRHTIGNIILLPQKENASVGNAPWNKKKIFYRALIAKTEEERNEQFEKAKKAGLTFKKQTEVLVKKQGRLHMLDPIAEVNNWTEARIRKRTKNTLELAWDVIAPWLKY